MPEKKKIVKGKNMDFEVTTTSTGKEQYTPIKKNPTRDLSAKGAADKIKKYKKRRKDYLDNI